MDVMWWQAGSDLHQLLVDAASLDVNDWFRFVVEQPETEQGPQLGGGRRCLLAGLQPQQWLPLHQALHATFEAHNTHPPPLTLSTPHDSWIQPLRRMANETGLAWRDLGDAVTAVRQFVDPILHNQNVGKWNPITWIWEP
jgi:hypothetical protein